MEIVRFYLTKTSPFSIHSCIFEILYLQFSYDEKSLEEAKSTESDHNTSNGSKYHDRVPMMV